MGARAILMRNGIIFCVDDGIIVEMSNTFVDRCGFSLIAESVVDFASSMLLWGYYSFL